jgi:hypothetical protein
VATDSTSRLIGLYSPAPRSGKFNTLPGPDILRDLFSYSVIEGALYWKKRLSSRARLDTPAGCTDREGYMMITINGKSYRRHRLIWAYFYGDPGTNTEIDHINRIKGDDRIENLRLATRQENSYNVVYSTNKSGHPGVCWHKRDKKWRVSIRVNGVNKHLGYYTQLDDACQAYKTAALKYHGSYSVCAS